MSFFVVIMSRESLIITSVANAGTGTPSNTQVWLEYVINVHFFNP